MPGPPPLPEELPPPTLDGVASWMLAELSRRDGVLPAELAALEVVRLFGGDFCDVQSDGRFTISRPVLDAFARAWTRGDREVVWDPAERAWRFSGKRPSPYR